MSSSHAANGDGQAILVGRDDSSDSGDDTLNCGSGGGSNEYFNLRIASIFIILVTSLFGALLPILLRSQKGGKIRRHLFDFAKYFGSGVIIATAFIHLLAPAIDELSSPCLKGEWENYPWALALCMLSIFSIFFIELFLFRWGTSILRRTNASYDHHGHDLGSHAAHGPEGTLSGHTTEAESRGGVPGLGEDSEHAIAAAKLASHSHSHSHPLSALDSSALAQVTGIFVLEFGILLHSLLIGLTLAVDADFKVLFVVLVFHQTFEGLGLGVRLAMARLPPGYDTIRYAGALLFGFTTPLGIAIGLGVRRTYNPGSSTATVVSGVMDALSAGILIYTGLVELLAHEFLFDEAMKKTSDRRLCFACVCMVLGAGVMALLGRWA